MNTATLKPVRREVGAPRNGRPSYRWTTGVQIITPDGHELQPYMSEREARAYCKREGWVVKKGS